MHSHSDICGRLASGDDQLADLREPLSALIQEMGASDRAPAAPIEYFSAVARLSYQRPIAISVWRRDSLLGVVFGSDRRPFSGIGGLPVVACVSDDSIYDFIICRGSHRSAVLRAAIGCLAHQRSIHSLILTLRSDEIQTLMSVVDDMPRLNATVTSDVRRDTLHLGTSYQGFLARLGSRTRHNMRYYPRKAALRGWTFVPDMEHDRVDAAVRDLVQHQRKTNHKYGTVSQLPAIVNRLGTPLICGLLDSQGKPLSVSIGYYAQSSGYIITQLNHGGSEYDRAALSTVLRAHLIQHLISLGVHDLTLVAGWGGRLAPYCPPVLLQTATIRKLGIFSAVYWAYMKRRYAVAGGQVSDDPGR